jgi:hypothetical protein
VRWSSRATGESLGPLQGRLLARLVEAYDRGRGGTMVPEGRRDARGRLLEYWSESRDARDTGRGWRRRGRERRRHRGRRYHHVRLTRELAVEPPEDALRVVTSCRIKTNGVSELMASFGFSNYSFLADISSRQADVGGQPVPSIVKVKASRALAGFSYSKALPKVSCLWLWEKRREESSLINGRQTLWLN